VSNPYDDSLYVALRSLRDAFGTEQWFAAVASLAKEAGLLDEQTDVRPNPYDTIVDSVQHVVIREESGVDDGTRTRDNRNHNPPLSPEDSNVYAKIVQR
jgi:hypothetical protein